MSSAANTWTEADYYRSFRQPVLPQQGLLKTSLITAGIVATLGAGVVGLRLMTLDGDPFTQMWQANAQQTFPLFTHHSKLAVLDPVGKGNEINVAPEPMFVPVMGVTPVNATITGDEASSLIAATETDVPPQPNVWEPARCGEGCVAAADAMADGRDPEALPPQPASYVDGYAVPYRDAPPPPRPRTQPVYADDAPPPPVVYAERPQRDLPPPPEPEDGGDYIIIDNGG